MTRAELAHAPRWVIKVGSSLVTNEGRGLDHASVARWAAEIAQLSRAGKSIVLVSSGAIAEGMQRLGWPTRPRAIHDLQAADAVGQMGLVQAYEREWEAHTEELERFCGRYALGYIHADAAQPFQDVILKTFRKGRFLA